MAHPQVVGDELRLIMATAARAVGVDFLDGDNVGIEVIDDPRNALGADLAVEPAAAVDIVGHHADGEILAARRMKRHAFFPCAVSTEEVHGDFPQIFTPDSIRGVGQMSDMPAANAIGQQ